MRLVNQEIAKSYPKIKHVNEVLTLHMGPEFILLNLGVDFADSLSAGDVEDTIPRLDRHINRRIRKSNAFLWKQIPGGRSVRIFN